jgi:hypothetical protein
MHLGDSVYFIQAFAFAVICICLFDEKIYRVIILFAKVAFPPIAIPGRSPCSSSLLNKVMIALILTYNQIRSRVVVNLCGRWEKFSKCLFCYKAGFKNVSAIIGKGMIGNQKLEPSIIYDALASLPVVMFFPRGSWSSSSAMSFKKATRFAPNQRCPFVTKFNYGRLLTTATLTVTVRDCILRIGHRSFSFSERLLARAVGVSQHLCRSFFYTEDLEYLQVQSEDVD